MLLIIQIALGIVLGVLILGNIEKILYFGKYIFIFLLLCLGIGLIFLLASSYPNIFSILGIILFLTFIIFLVDKSQITSKNKIKKVEIKKKDA